MNSDRHNSSARKDEYEDWDASYVLGALPTDQRLQYEQHLSECSACRAAVAELAGMPGIVGRLSLEEALAISASDEAKVTQPPSVTLRAAAHRVRARRRVRRLLASFAVATTVAASIFGGFALGAGVTDTPVAEAKVVFEPMSPTSEHPALTAGIHVEGKPWGTRLEWNCAYSADAPADAEYELVVTQTDGSTTTVATWAATGYRAVDLAASTGIARAEIRGVDIRVRGADSPLVHANT